MYDGSKAPVTPQQLPDADHAVRILRSDPQYADLVRDAYLGPDVEDSARRFQHSGEFVAVRQLLGDRLAGAAVLDVGAGTGIASAALGAGGAARVIALEPDSSDEVGRGAIARLAVRNSIEIMSGWGEDIPLDDATVDIVYARQCLHHATDLDLMVRECARVLRPGGLFVACREHVVDDEGQLRAFLAAHPVHQLVGGENAFSLEAYLNAIRSAGLVLDQLLGPWDTVINAFPLARSEGELSRVPRTVLERRLGRLGSLIAAMPFAQRAVWRWLRRQHPGRLYTFLATKPAPADRL